MKRASWLILALVILVATTLPVLADDPIYYVKAGNTGCQDGSKDCPFTTRWKAIEAGKQQICENRQFEVWEWDSTRQDFVYVETLTGERPIPGTGVPIAQSVIIIAIALAGCLLLGIALRLKGKKAQ